MVPTTPASRRKVIKWTFFDPDFFQFRKETAQKLIAKTGSDSPAEFELLSFVEADKQCAEELTRPFRLGVSPDDKFLLQMQLYLDPCSGTLSRLIPGTGSFTNQISSPSWNAQVKDRLEGKLHELVCSGQLDLKTAQQDIAADWIEAYKMYVSPNPPISRVTSPTASESPLNADEVWVNTKSGKYWKPGSRYYGKTKQGEYMSEKEAVQKGYRPANGTGE